MSTAAQPSTQHDLGGNDRPELPFRILDGYTVAFDTVVEATIRRVNASRSRPERGGYPLAAPEWHLNGQQRRYHRQPDEPSVSCAFSY